MKGEQLVQGFTKRLMADVNEGHTVMLQVSGHWLLIAKIQDEITCFDPKKNGFCVFSCALQLWKRKMRLEAERAGSLTPGQEELLKFFQTKDDSKKSKKEVYQVTGTQSFAEVMEIGSMSRHIYESETREGKAAEQDKTGKRLQWRNPDNLGGPEEEQELLEGSCCSDQGERL